MNSEAPGKYELGDITFPEEQSRVRPIVRPATTPEAPPAAPPAPVAPPAPAQAPVPLKPAAVARLPLQAASSEVRAGPQAPTRGRELVAKKLAQLAGAQQLPDGLAARLGRRLAGLHPGYVVLALACLVVFFLQSRPEVGPGEEMAADEPDQLESEPLPIVPVNSVLVAFPTVLRPPAAAAMRLKVGGAFSTGVQWGARDGEVSCMLVQHNAGQTEARIRALLTTGRAVPIPPDAMAKLSEVAHTMRMARGGKRLKFTPICLSI